MLAQVGALLLELGDVLQQGGARLLGAGQVLARQDQVLLQAVVPAAQLEQLLAAVAELERKGPAATNGGPPADR